MADQADTGAPTIDELTLVQVEARMEEISNVLERIHEHDEITNDDELRFNQLADEFDKLVVKQGELRRKRTLEAVRDRVPHDMGRTVARRVTGGMAVPPDIDSDPIGEPDSIETYTRGGRNPWDLDEMRTVGRSPQEQGAELRARALSAIERMSGTTDERRKAMTDIIERYDTDRGKLARLALVSSSPEYMRAFSKAIRYSLRGMTPNFTDTERLAVDRAMSLTDTAGGFLVPFQLDPTVIITSDGTFNQVRQAARQVIATGDTWNGVSSAAVTWSWDAEAAEVSDDATTFAQPSIAIHMARGFVPISIEAFEDEANVAGEVGRLLAFGKETLEATAFTTGDGSGQPFGISAALEGNTNVQVATTTADEFGLVDVYALDDALPARHRFRASWLAHRGIYNDVRQFDTSGGAGLWVRLADDVPARLLDRPAYESEAMDSDVTASNTYILIYGDFSNYVIADRIGTTVELIPHLFATASNLPSGQRGWFARFRAGADSVSDTAFRILKSDAV